MNFVHPGEHHPFTEASRSVNSHESATHHDVLRRADDRRTIGRTENIVRRHHQGVSFHLSFNGQRQMNSHLVPIEVGVKATADQRVQADCISLDERRLKRLNAHTMERRSPIQHHWMICDYFIKDIPDFLVFSFKHTFRRLDCVGVSKLFKSPDYEWLKQL